jgi:hypothetical protein
MHARYYMMSRAKFINVDPGRDFDPRRPQSWNLYTYVRNNPINAFDPDGRTFKGPTQAEWDKMNWFEQFMMEWAMDPVNWVPGPGIVGGVADDGVGLLAKGARMIANRVKGKLFEAKVIQALGLKAGETQVVISMREFASKFRVADGLTDAVVIEVKGTNKLDARSQIKDLIRFAESSGRKLVIIIREDTKVSSAMEALEKAGKVIIERVGNQ